MRKLILISAATAMLSTGALAQQSDERFTLEKTADGYVRMDKHSGEMSICRETSGQLVCKLAADDRQAFESEVERLQDTLASLEKRVTALEGEPRNALPTDEEFDRTMGYMQRFFRGFMDIVKEWDQDLRGQPPETDQRT